MGFELLFSLGDFFLPQYLQETLLNVRLSLAADASRDIELRHKSLLENRELLKDLFRTRLWTSLFSFITLTTCLSALMLDPGLMLPFLIPRLLITTPTLFLIRAGLISSSHAISFSMALTVALNIRSIWFPSDPMFLNVPPILRFYQTFTSGLPVTAFYAMGARGVIPFGMVTVSMMFGSFFSSMNNAVPFVLHIEQQTPMLVYGVLIQIVPLFVVTAIDEEARFYHSLLLKSLRNTEKKSKAKTTFISRMSHELRTPLQGLLASATLLKETVLTDDQMTYISIINSCGDLLLTIMEKILDITRIESGKFETQMQPFSLLGLVPSLLESVVGLSSAKGLDLFLKFDLTARSYVVHGDQKHLKGILTNLIGNAVKFTEKGSVMVAVSVKERSLLPLTSMSIAPEHENSAKVVVYRFEVKDTGRGIPERVLPDLFEPFTKAYNYHESEGSGLGLSISKRFTEALGGMIGVETTVGVGSTFWAEIPFQVLDANSMGPFLELPQFISTTVGAYSPVIGVFARPELLRIIEGYFGYWGLRFEVVEDLYQLGNFPSFILEERKLSEAYTSPLSSHLNAGSPEVLLNLLNSFSTSQSSLLSPIFRKGMILTSLSSFHRMKISLQSSGYFDRVSVVSEPLGPTTFRQGMIKMLGEGNQWDIEGGDGHLFSEGSSDSRGRSVTPLLVSAPAFSPAQAPVLTPLLGSEERLDVLLVEDNPVNQAVMRKLFEKLKITFAITGKAEESLLIWEQYPLGITLILMDIELDGPMTGLEATTIIRQKEMQSIGFAPGDAGSRHQQRVKSYIAIMTGRALEEDRREAFSCGCDDFLVKPVALNKVKDLISTLVSGKN